MVDFVYIVMMMKKRYVIDSLFLDRNCYTDKIRTCITLIGSPVSFANCSRMCLVGFGVCEKAVFKISNCFALIVVRGPLRFEPAPLSSGLLFSVWESLVSGSPSNEFWSSESSWPVFESLNKTTTRLISPEIHSS